MLKACTTKWEPHADSDGMYVPGRMYLGLMQYEATHRYGGHTTCAARCDQLNKEGTMNTKTTAVPKEKKVTRSGRYVIYRKATDGATFYYGMIQYWKDIDPSTPHLHQASQWDRETAFKYAVAAVNPPHPWAVGELVSTAEGVKVDE